jgi:hypothetical protein
MTARFSSITCPHCGKKIERAPKVHYDGWRIYGGHWGACGNLYGEHTTDRSLVTCLSCQKTKAFREAK